ncbi:hypothetical protein [Streptomyces sp. NPDC048419]|uniref:hypothetical protein n=1 Tax=Streptomyces sp. NPDC048419 TaxID=3365547 RepID=UPI003716DAB4
MASHATKDDMYTPMRKLLPAVISALFCLTMGLPHPAHAETPASTTDAPWIVSLGDSAISGEAGRWAGNTEANSSSVDALGPDAYFDNSAGTAEEIIGCHRSRSAEVHIANGTNSLNLACSGAHTSTVHAAGQDFKPGLDFYADAEGRKSQTIMLREFATRHRVRAIAVLIDANNYGFSDIVRTCVLSWYFSPSWDQRHCQDDPSMVSRFSTRNIDIQTHLVTDALRNIERAMRQAGYSTNSYTILAQTYSPPIPPASGFRYPETGHARAKAGCAIWDADANWVHTTVVPALNNTIRRAVAASGLSNVKVLEARNALDGHRLCEKGVGRLEEAGLTSWKSPSASEQTEWAEQVRTISTVFGPYQLQEDGHPSYWGQLALRNCLRQAYNNGVPRSGTCRPDTGGKNSFGEPNMSLH